MIAASPQEKFPVYLQKVERVEKLPKPCKYGGVAQLGEHLPCKQGVRSSILLISTKGRRKTETTTVRRKSNGLVAQVVRAHA